MTRARVIIDNDFAGDPDDLFQLAHHVLAPDVQIPFVIGSHLAPGDLFDPSDAQADHAVDIARNLLGLLDSSIPAIAGSNVGLPDRHTPIRTAASDAIVAEALRRDTELPLFVAAGGGLTEVASALLYEPRIAEQMTVVWVGGPEYPPASAPPGAGPVEYNLAIDIAAAQVVFASGVRLWQLPRETYRQLLVSLAEIRARVAPHGPVGRLLAGRIESLHAMAAAQGFDLGQTYCLGDSGLVLVTALHAPFEPDASSSAWVDVAAPAITDDGAYGPAPDPERLIRVFTRLDTRLLFEDLFLTLAEHAARREGTS